VKAKRRCGWASNARELDIDYHDREWGVPVHDDRTLFEFLTLEGAQAGLSWTTILAKREGYRDAFRGFDPERVARFGARDRTRLLRDARIVRNRLKIDAAIANARMFIKVQEACGSFDRYLWAFVDGKPIQNAWRTLAEVPARTPLSDRLSKDLKQRGFRFVGSTICYALLQATGLVNDHEIDCFRYPAVARLGRRSLRGA
jgi:DNA-3-methyladenine glycosylase I